MKLNRILGKKTTIEADELVIKDKAGRPRIVLGVDDDTNEPAIGLLDQQGVARISLQIQANPETGLEDPVVTLIDADGHSRVLLIIGNGSVPAIGLQDKNLTPRLILSINQLPNTEAEQPVIEFLDKDGEEQNQLPRDLFPPSDQK